MPCGCREGGADGGVPADTLLWARVVEGTGGCLGPWLIAAVVVRVEVDIWDGAGAGLVDGFDCRDGFWVIAAVVAGVELGTCEVFGVGAVGR